MLQYAKQHGIRLATFGVVAGGWLSDAWLGAPAPGPAAMKTVSMRMYKGRLDACAPLHEMKGAALQERHWARLLKLLRLERVPLSQLTLEHLWSADLVAQRARVADVLAVAQGEMALEEFLRGTGVREARIVPADMLRLSVESVEIAQGAIELSAANAASTPPAAPIPQRPRAA